MNGLLGHHSAATCYSIGPPDRNKRTALAYWQQGQGRGCAGVGSSNIAVRDSRMYIVKDCDVQWHVSGCMAKAFGCNFVV